MFIKFKTTANTDDNNTDKKIQEDIRKHIKDNFHDTCTTNTCIMTG